jgi:hypothetical protein
MLSYHGTVMHHHQVVKIKILCFSTISTIPAIPGSRLGGRVESTVVLEVDVPRSCLRRSRKGRWFCPRDLPPDRIKRALCFAKLAGTSTEA